MAEKSRNTNLLLLVCALTSAIVFFGCGGGDTSTDPIPLRTYQISGKITSNTALASVIAAESGIRGAFDAANVEVYVEQDRSTYSTSTDENGYFSLTVPEGSYYLVACITTTTGDTYKVRSGQVSVSRTRPQAELTDLQLQEAKSVVNGMIKDSSGNPIPNAKIMVWGEPKYTDASGKFTTPPMPDGITAPIKFVTSGYQEAELQVSFDEDNPLYIEQTIVGQGSTNRPPVISLSATSYEITTGQTTSLSASAVDPDNDTPLTYVWNKTHGSLATRSSGLSAIWTAPDTSTLATISVTVSDPKGLSASAFVAIKVGAGSQQGDQNHSPVVTEIQTATTTFMNNSQYELTAIATDSDGDALTYTWSAARGTLSPTDQKTTTWTTPDISGTEYVQVSVLVSDGNGGSGQRTATYTVSTDPNPPENQAPTATIASPANGSLFPIGSVAYSGTATDPEDGELGPSSFKWYQHKLGGTKTLIGNQTKSFSMPIYEPGTYVVELEVNDRLGGTDLVTSSFRINSNPSAQITEPDDATVFQSGESISFSGTGTDIEDVNIDGASLSWNFAGISTASGASVFVNDLPAGTNTIELYAYDSLGAKSEKDFISVYINSNPKVNSISPASGTVYLSGEDIDFTVSVTDTDEIIATSSIIWKRGATNLGTGDSITVNDLPIGLQIITVDVPDSMGGSVSSSTSVVINQRPAMSIDSPVNDTFVFPDQEFTFEGSGSSAFGPVASSTMTWQDFYNSATSTFTAGEGKSSFTHTFETSKLGKHIITLHGTDEYGASSYTQNILWVNATPSVTINSPASATRFDLGETISFIAGATDLDDDDPLTVTWFDGDDQIGTSAILSSNSLASGNHNITCEVTDQHGISDLASISVFVNTLPTGTINITTEQYATAPANLPVFITPDKNLRVDFTIDSYDAEIGGPIESYDPNNLIWYANTGDGAGYVHCGNGSTLSQDLPVGSTTIKVEIYDSFYGKHPNATETMTIAHKHLHIWQSIDFAYTSALIPAASPVFITGKDKKLYITDNISAEIHECTFEKAVATGPLSLDETHTPDASFALDNGLCGVLFDSKVTLLGAEGLDLKLISFGSVPTGSPITQNDLNLTTSIAFNSKNTAAKTAYAANQGEVISFHSETGAFIGQTDPVLSLGNMLRVRFSTAFSPNGNVFIADKENNRVVFLSPDLSNPTSKNAASPIDMAFTKTMLMTLDDSTDEISLINPVTNNILMKFGGTGATPGKFSNPISIYSTGQDLFVLEDGKMQVIRTKFADWLRP